MVGIANANAAFLYTGCRLPNAGAVMYWFPTKWYMSAPQSVKTTTSAIVTAQSAFGKSRGFFISAMNCGRGQQAVGQRRGETRTEGSVIWPTKVYVMLRKADMPATYVVPGTGRRVTRGSCPAMYPNGWSWMPAKMMASSTATPIVAALKMPRPLSWLSGRGRETKKQTTAVTTLQTTVHAPWPSVSVLSSFAPTRQCRAASQISVSACSRGEVRGVP